MDRASVCSNKLYTELHIQSPRRFQLCNSMISQQYECSRYSPLSRFLCCFTFSLTWQLLLHVVCSFLAYLFILSFNRSAGSPMPDVDNKVRSDTRPPPTPSKLSWGHRPAGERDISQHSPYWVCGHSLRWVPEHRWAWRTWPRCMLGVPLSNWHAQWNAHRAWDGWSKVGEWVSLVIGVPPPLLKPPSPPTWAHVIITLHPSLGQFLTLGISPEPSFLPCQNLPVCCLTSLCLAQP